jgi:hypothetical protein
VDNVDLIEVNHYYDEHGKLVFGQLIFWDWNSEECRPRVIAWRALKDREQLPVIDWRTGGVVAIWLDGDLLRQVKARSRLETWTQYDPEFVERQWFPDKRRGLRE